MQLALGQAQPARRAPGPFPAHVTTLPGLRLRFLRARGLCLPGQPGQPAGQLPPAQCYLPPGAHPLLASQPGQPGFRVSAGSQAICAQRTFLPPWGHLGRSKETVVMLSQFRGPYCSPQLLPRGRKFPNNCSPHLAHLPPYPGTLAHSALFCLLLRWTVIVMTISTTAPCMAVLIFTAREEAQCTHGKVEARKEQGFPAGSTMVHTPVLVFRLDHTGAKGSP